jgi:hypothetical protein
VPLDHYVSQVHLRKFYSPKIGEERMYAMRKSDLKSFQPNSKSVCRIEDGSTNAYLKEDRAIEEFLKTIEPKYNEALSKLIEDKIDAECVYTLAGFAAYVSACSPAGMRIQSGPMKSTLEAAAAIVEAHGGLPAPPKELGGDSLTELLRAGTVRFVVDPKYPQAIGIKSIFPIIATFGNFRWDVLVNGLEHNPFFTSDFPIAIEVTKDLRIVNRIVPLAPNLAIRIRPDLSVDTKRADFSFANFSHRRRSVSHKEVVEINRLIVRCAEDAVFYRDDSPWISKFIARNRHYRVEPVTRKLPTSKGTFMVSTLRIMPVLFHSEDAPA